LEFNNGLTINAHFILREGRIEGYAKENYY